MGLVFINGVIFIPIYLSSESKVNHHVPSREDDLAVSVHTEWLDYDGFPLPAELGADLKKRVAIPPDYSKRPALNPRAAAQFKICSCNLVAKVTSTRTPDVDALRQNSTNAFL